MGGLTYSFLKRSPDTASAEDLRRYQLYMVNRGASPISINTAIIGLKFFFNITLDRPKLMAKIQSVHLPLKLQVVLGREELLVAFLK